MIKYLDRFNTKLKKEFKGSLVKVDKVRDIEPNAKEYLNKLAKAGYIQSVVWGWYWVPDNYKDFYDFLKKDKNFKILSAQSAASFWDYDFIHREIYNIKVDDKSFKSALEAFAKIKDWKIAVEYVDDPDKLRYIKRGGIYIETREETIIECIQKWAFLDAFAVLYTNRNRIILKELKRRAYWNRISKSRIRVRQAIDYGSYKLFKLLGDSKFKTREISIDDEFIKNDIDEAIDRVVEFA